ncbi:MAG: shikimate kinase [Parachlamydiales bacterium]|nr:shikimate kinase [Parachlamydiales bacterium]
MNLLLFGFKASGKTHFGKLLSHQMHRPFIDTDDLIIELYKKETDKQRSCRQIHKELGEDAFRQLEKRALHLLKNVQNSIIALGGGAILDPKNVEFLQTIGALVFLKASPEKLKARVLKDEIPSFLDPKDPEGSFYRMIQEREPIYRAIRARVIDTDALDEAGVLAALSSILFLEEPPNGF